MPDNKCVFFLPVYDQVRELPLVLQEIEDAALPHVDFLIINNGSTDGSEVLVRESGHSHLDVVENLGIGHSYLMALDWANARGYQIFGTMASNAKMLPSEIPRLLKPIEDGSADYVTGSRFLEGGQSPNLPWFRKATIPVVNLVARLATGARLTDATNGFRAFRLNIVDRAEFDLRAPWLSTYEFEYYLYAKVLLDKQLVATEVPSTMRYPTTGRYSKIRPVVDWWRMIKPWILARRGGTFRSESSSSE